MANIDQMIEKKEKRADSLRRQIETASGQLKNLLMEIKVLKYEKLEQVANTEETNLRDTYSFISAKPEIQEPWAYR